MKSTLLVLIFIGVCVAQSLDCSTAPCPDFFTESCDNSCGNEWNGCCETCCTKGCADCFADPCAGWGCNGYPGYECRSNYCGDCNRDWFSSEGFRVQCEDEVFGQNPCATSLCAGINPGSCECGLEKSDACCKGCCENCVECLLDPCDGWSCTGYPGYRCESNYCEDCSRNWFDSNDHPVVCEWEAFGEDPCAMFDCPTIDPDTCDCGMDSDFCCAGCCECKPCFDACEGFFCADSLAYTCEVNGCNCERSWFDAQGFPVTCSDERPTAICNVACIQFDAGDCKCGSVLTEDGCCETCCDDCVECDKDPCEDYSCQGYPGYSCEPSTCRECGRKWFNSEGRPVECDIELVGQDPCAAVTCEPLPEGCDCLIPDDACCPTCCGAPPIGSGADWNTQCKQDSDCILENKDLGYACCWAGICGIVDYSLDSWRPVNAEWWQKRHEQCSENCGPPPACAYFPHQNTHIISICSDRECVKYDSNLAVTISFDDFNPSSDSDSSETSHSSHINFSESNTSHSESRSSEGSAATSYTQLSAVLLFTILSLLVALL